MESNEKQWETLGFQIVATRNSAYVPGTLLATASSLDLAHTISTIPELQEENRQLKELLEEAKLQIEYLHEKFKATGTGNSVLIRIDSLLQKLNHGN